MQHGVWLNIGSAVLMPEVLLKAVSVVHNLGYSLDGFVDGQCRQGVALPQHGRTS